MNKTGKGFVMAMLLCTFMILIIPAIASANSAEPPSLVIIINNPPDDLSITLLSSKNQPEASIHKVAWEGYYVFYNRDMLASDGYTFMVTTNGESFEYVLDIPLKSYNNVVTLDLSNRKLELGKYPFRSVLLVSLRLVFTLVIEGIVFWLFRFKHKRSWMMFFAINLITQGVLNVWLNSEGSPMPSYLIISLIVGEIFVFITEMTALTILIKEHKKSYILAYAFLANLISLITGGYIITVLPV
ncbi:MAG: hypothetical protein A2Y23_06685 [Clostridiales bacterium GWB2_37_7]|nr:MAG: hypothetical protein A2Y23_06685 [Clostridiales bacterium GWB2_37_7]